MAFRVLCGDPGSVNFALSVLEYDKGKLRVLGTKMMTSTFKDLSARTVVEDLNAFSEEIEELIVQWKPDAMYFERFQFRGSGISTIEAVNVMLGLLMSLAHVYGVKARLITASTWKNNFNNNCADLKQLYKAHKLTSKHSPKAIHEFDSALIGVYTIYDMLTTKVKPFQGFDVDAFFEQFICAPNL